MYILLSWPFLAFIYFYSNDYTIFESKGLLLSRVWLKHFSIHCTDGLQAFQAENQQYNEKNLFLIHWHIVWHGV